MAISNRLRQLMLVISVCCLAIHANSLGEGKEAQVITSGCFVAYVIIGAAFLSDVMDGPLPGKVSFMFDVMGGILFLVAAVFCIQHYKAQILYTTRTEDMILAKGVLGLINGGLYLWAAYKN